MPLGLGLDKSQTKSQPNPQIKFEMLVKNNIPCIFLEVKQRIHQVL